MSRKRIVILGGGSGGLELAARLASHKALEVVLVDRVGSHLWKPRLHEFAAGTVSSTLSEISFYILGQLRGFRFEQGEVVGLDHQAKEVRLAAIPGPDGGEIAAERRVAYDLCVVALGGVTTDFGVPGVAENAVRLDAKVDADRFRALFVSRMIAARETGEPADIVIVGSGATGTELAAHLRNSERAFFDRREGPRDKLLNLTILEAAPEIMPGAGADLREGVAKRLKALDIKVVTDAKIVAVEPTEVRTASGEAWPADATVWAAGMIGHPVLGRLGGFELDGRGRIRTDARLRSTVDSDVYVLGDAAAVVLGDKGALLPTAQVAGQEADYLAKALPGVVAGREPAPFVFRDKGRLISLGGAGTVGLIGIPRRNDLFVDGRFAIAAYRGLQRRHQWTVLGAVRGTLAIVADMLSPTRGPALKLHG